jgi:enoyl-CoA hydratase/carnithine racemase
MRRRSRPFPITWLRTGDRGRQDFLGQLAPIPNLQDRRTRLQHFNLSRPQKRNAMNANLVHRLNTLFDSQGCSPNVRVIVLSDLGQGFCAGGDIGELAAMTPVGAHSTRPAS